MVNTKLLREKIDNSGYKIYFVAEKCSLSYQGFLKKLNNETEFKATEIMVLRTLLKISDAEVDPIFFS
jgi:hypothetical protein